MIHDEQQRTPARNSVDAFHVDIAVVPAERYAGNRANQNVHRYARRTDRSGTPRRMSAETTNIAAPVMTAARYAMAVPRRDSSPSTVPAQMSGPTIAAARDE